MTEIKAAPLPLTRWVLLVVVLAAALVLTWQTARVIERQQQVRFNYEVNRVQSAIVQRMNAYVQVLRGGRGLFEASSEVTRDDWRVYVERQRLSEHYPGIRSMTFARRVVPAELPAFIARVRAEPPLRFANPAVVSQFALRAPPPPIVPAVPVVHAAVLYTEPLNADSERALGIDMMRDLGRQQALNAAVALDDAVLSPRLRVLSREGTQVGFIAFLPVQREGQPLGWLTATFHADTFMRELLGPLEVPLEFEIFDGEANSADALMYSTAGADAQGTPLPLPAGAAEFEARRTLAMPGRLWTAHYRAPPGFTGAAENSVPWLVALGGVLSLLLLGVLARAGAAWQAQARVLAEQARELGEARAAADSANAAKSLFLASMSHEIRTPLNAILGTAELLGDTPLNPSQQQSVATITQSGDHLLGVINDILDFTKVEAGLLTLEDAPFDLRAVVQSALTLVAQRAAEKHLTLHTHVHDTVPPYLRGDAGRVRQILLNYLANAIKFTERGSVTLTVSAEPMEQRRYRIRMAVRDTGIGIAPHQQGSLFQSFTQVEAASTRRYGGTGLGLAICKRLAERMGGEVGVQSALGEGSTFTCTWVAQASDAPALMPVVTDAPATPLPALRILLVEDNALNRQVGQRMLESLGQSATVATTGVEAVAAVRQQAFDLLLMDVHMPEMDGLEATRHIRAMADIAQPEIFAMSASVLDEERQACLDAGMSRHLAKPFRRAELEQALREVAAAREHITATPAPTGWPALVQELGEAGARALCEALLDEADTTLAAMQQALEAGAAWQATAAELQANASLLGASALAQQWAALAHTADVAVARTQSMAAMEGYRAVCALLKTQLSLNPPALALPPRENTET